MACLWDVEELLQSTGCLVSFVAGPGQVIIRPMDGVPGYFVQDGRPTGRCPRLWTAPA
jgi:hypothetical protein